MNLTPLLLLLLLLLFVAWVHWKYSTHAPISVSCAYKTGGFCTPKNQPESQEWCYTGSKWKYTMKPIRKSPGHVGIWALSSNYTSFFLFHETPNQVQAAEECADNGEGEKGKGEELASDDGRECLPNDVIQLRKSIRTNVRLSYRSCVFLI